MSIEMREEGDEDEFNPDLEEELVEDKPGYVFEVLIGIWMLCGLLLALAI